MEEEKNEVSVYRYKSEDVEKVYCLADMLIFNNAKLEPLFDGLEYNAIKDKMIEIIKRM